MPSSFRRYLATGEGRIALAIVVAFALAFSYFVTRTFVEPLPRQYPPEFGAAQWIQMPTPASAGYFRKTLYISGSVEQAWIVLSATGGYQLYVNNIEVDHTEFPAVRVSGAYDLRPLLSAGKNVIAIYVTSGVFPAPPQIRVRGGYQGPDTPVQEFFSDSSWKVSGTPDGILGSYSWSSPILNDTLWSRAATATEVKWASSVQPLTIDPLLLQDRPAANWIIAPGAERSEASFRTNLELPFGYPQAWLRVAANAAYDVIINDRLAAMTPIVTQATLFGPQAPVELAAQVVNEASMSKIVTPLLDLAGSETLATIQPQTPSVTSPAPEPASIAPYQSMGIPSFDVGTGVSMPDLAQITVPPAPPAPQLIPLATLFGAKREVPALIAYDVSKYLRSGENSIVVRVHSSNQPAVLLADGVVRFDKGEEYRFGTDARWSAFSHAPPAGGRVTEQALVVAKYGAAPWGPPPRVAASSLQWLPGQDLRSAMRWGAVAAAVGGLVFLLWLVAAPLCTSDPADVAPLWTRDALLQLPMLVGLLALLIVSCDVRIYPYRFFQGVVVIPLALLLLMSKLALLAPIKQMPVGSAVQSYRDDVGFGKWQWVVLLCLVAAGLVVRARGLLNDPMSDEIAMIRMALGIFKRGVPFIRCGSFTEYAATYELLTYPLALSMLFLGQTVVAVRMPALLFGGCAIALIGWVGYRMMGWRVGLVSAAIFAFLPTTVSWARDGYYPSEESVITLAAFWFFYETIRDRELNYRFLRYASAGAVISYLTWEGSAFLIPSLFFAIVVVRWGDFRWMVDAHVWRCFIVVSLMVGLELSYRKLVLLPDYLGAVRDLTEVSGPMLIFLDRILFDPLYYLRAFFFIDNQVLLSVLVILGIVFARKVRPLLYLFVVLGALEIFYTCFLANYSLRYCYYWTAPLILAGVGTFFHLCDKVSSLKVGPTISVIRTAALCGAGAILVLSANPLVMEAYRLSWQPEQPPYFTRLGVTYKPNFLSADRYVAQHLAPGDVVVVTAPHVFLFDTKRLPDYWNDTVLLNRVTYDGGRKVPDYIDKWVGVPTIRTLDDLKRVRAEHGRVWWIQLNMELNAPDVITYLKMKGRIVHEGFDATVVRLDGAGPPAVPPALVGGRWPTRSATLASN